MMLRSGYILLEALLASVMFVIVAVALISSLDFYQSSFTKSTSQSEAYLLASEGLEVAYNVYLANWNFPFATSYHPSLLNNAWTLVPGDQTNLHAKYTRQLAISQVCRSQTGEQTSCSTGSVDTHTHLATTTISWQDPTGPKSINLSLLLYQP